MVKLPKFEPSKITKPIQLTAASIICLTSIISAFLIGATKITEPSWIPGALVIASILLVSFYFMSVFLLQTRFRDESLDDESYIDLKKSQTGNTERQINPDSVASLREEFVLLKKLILENQSAELRKEEIENNNWSASTISLNKGLPDNAKIRQMLSSKGIPVHEVFGLRNKYPKPFSIAVGSGFEVEQIKLLVEIISEFFNGWIFYADSVGSQNDNKNKIFIGAYGSYAHGIELNKLLRILNNENKSISEVYELLGKK